MSTIVLMCFMPLGSWIAKSISKETFGIGIKSNEKFLFPIDLDYSFSNWGILQMVHRFSIAWSI